MNRDPQEIESEEHAQIAHAMMQKQAVLSLQVGAIFLLLVLGLPLFNLYFPEMAGKSVFGFTLTWFILGICFFPLTWLLSSYFVRNSDQIEAEFARKGRVLTMTGSPIDNMENASSKEEN